MSIQNTNLPDNPNVDVIKAGKTGLFTNYIYKAIPLAFDESMSYYETLCGLLDYLKNTVIPTVNNNADAVSELQTLYEELKTYVDDYFTNLDVQEEINNKLDSMAKDGSLTALIKNYIDPLYQAYENEINETITSQNSRIQTINDKVETATSGSPAGTYATVSALTTADPNHDKIYLVIKDGKWYYYDTTLSTWVAGGVYQANGIANKSVTYEKLADDINYNFEPEYHSIGSVTQGKYQPRTVEFQLSDSDNYKVLIVNDLTPGEKIYVTAKVATTASLDAITFFNSSNTRVQHPTPAPYDLDHEEYTVPANASYAVINCHTSYTIGCYTRTYKVKDVRPLLYNLDRPTLNRLSNKQFGNLSKGYVCFVTDDGHDELITNTLPIIQAKNVPFTFACWTDSQVITDAVKRQQVINAINTYGCRICQHGNASYRTLTKEELYNYLIQEQNKWKTYNIDVNGLCYPNHEHDNDIMAIAGSIFNVCATGGVIDGEYTGTKVIYPNETNGERTNMYELYRVSLYSHSLNQLKQSVDYAFDNNKLLILFTHDNDVTGNQATKIEDIIDYCKDKGITFTTINDLDKII